MLNLETDIVIVGAGLTGLTLAYYLNKKGRNVTLIEKLERVGGVIHTQQEDGFVFENGPTTGVIGSGQIAELFEDLSGDCTLELTNPESKVRWILKDNQWEPIPSGMMGAINTPLFSLKDKFRILGEPFRKRGTNPNETLAELVKRRMGKSFLDYAIDPFISGVYAGDPNKLITRYALPKLYRLEQDYGSFIKGAIKKKKAPKTELEKKASREVFSVEGGLGNLIAALERNIPAKNIYCSCSNVAVKPVEDEFVTTFDILGGESVSVSSKKVVSTVGGYALPNLLPFVDDSFTEPIAKTNYARLCQVAIGYSKWSGKPINAFGGLVPTVENKDYLGILFPGSLFKNRCPKDGALLSVFVGGIRKPNMIEKSDAEIGQIVQEAIKGTLNEQKQPDLLKVFRYQHAIPQYDCLSAERLEAISKIEKAYRGLILAGNIRDGIGMADRVAQAKQLSDIL